MKIPDTKIGTREFSSIVIILLGMKIADVTPHSIYKFAGNAGWMVPLIWFGIIGIPFLILLSLQKTHGKGLIELVALLLGKYTATLLTICIFIIIFNMTVFNSRSNIEIITVLFYPLSSVYFFYILLLGCSVIVARRGIVAIGRLAWLIIPLTQVVLFVLIVTVYSEVDLDRIYPIAGPGFLEIIKGSITNSGLFVDIFLITALFSHVRTVKNYQIATMVSLFYSIFILMFFLLYYVLIFDYPSTVRMAYPYQELTRIARFDETISHLDGIFLFFWILATLIRFSASLYLLSFYLGKLINSKKIEVLLIPLTGLVLLAGLLPDNIFSLRPIRNYELKITSAIFILLPFVLWIASRWKGRHKSENKQQTNH